MTAPEATQPAPAEASVELRGVRAGYGGVERLHGVDLALDPGAHLLIGANGSGKTTLLRVMAGVLPLSAGTVALGAAGSRGGQAGGRRAVGYVAHRPALSPRLSVAGELEFWGRVLGMPAGEREERSSLVIGRLGLAALLGRTIAELSRGQLQRVAIAKALLPDPQVLLLDEPFAGVDPRTAQEVRDQLRGLARSGRTIVISSHELAESAGMGAAVVVMAHGRVAAHGTAESLLPAAAGPGGEWMRLRAGDAALGRVAAMQLPHRVTGEGLEVRVADRAEAASVIRDLAGAGVEVYEFSPVRADLTRIFLHLQDDDPDPDHDPDPGHLTDTDHLTGAGPAPHDRAAGRRGHGPGGAR